MRSLSLYCTDRGYYCWCMVPPRMVYSDYRVAVVLERGESTSSTSDTVVRAMNGIDRHSAIAISSESRRGTVCRQMKTRPYNTGWVLHNCFFLFFNRTTMKKWLSSSTRGMFSRHSYTYTCIYIWGMTTYLPAGSY